MGFPEADIPRVVEMVKARLDKDYVKSDAIRTELEAWGCDIHAEKDRTVVDYSLGLGAVTVLHDDLSTIPRIV